MFDVRNTTRSLRLPGEYSARFRDYSRGTTLLLLVTLLGLATESPSVGEEWSNTGSGDWFAASNWTPANVPNASRAAAINNGGEATANATSGSTSLRALNILTGTNGGRGLLDVSNLNVEVEENLDVGVVDSVVATGAVDISATGEASFLNVDQLILGQATGNDLNVAQTSAANGATATGTGMFTAEQINRFVVGGDIDIGQASGDGTSTGMGDVIIRDVGTVLDVLGDIDTGVASAVPGGTNIGTGTIEILRAARVHVTGDLDIGQTTGDGTASGSGTVHLTNVADVTVDDSIDIAKVRAFDNARNFGVGHAAITNATASIGFGANNPGSIEIARVLVSENAVGSGDGQLILRGTSMTIANDVIVGELALGGTNNANTATALLQLVDSDLETRDLTVAARTGNTVGQLQGTVELVRSFLSVQSLLDLQADATLRLGIDGMVRANGLETAGRYSALDVDMVNLGGALEIVNTENYAGPAAGSSHDMLLLQSATDLVGDFQSVTYSGFELLDEVFTYVGTTGMGVDGLFSSLNVTQDTIELTNFLARPGDANGDNLIDDADLAILTSNRFRAGTNWTTGDFNSDGRTDVRDFNIWNKFKFTTVGAAASSVPEPTSMTLLVVTA
ncbi:MAG: hypothetical protein KDA60_00525, partial [Planctomycetales bacterium]|nr:hypothetical protein [Planctomycetales bacterium]